MPLTVQDGALVGAGMLFAGGATIFYRRKQTLPFKLAYFAAWPTLGTAVMLACIPRNDRLVADMKRRGLVSEEQIQEAHKQSVIQMQHIQDAAKHPNVKAPASSGS
ncbi:hypothetical protein WJX82_006502 [Trebouxia sp. C0006]